MADRSVALVAAAYGDFRSSGTLNPLQLLPASRLLCHAVLIDTYDKSGGSLFDLMTEHELADFIRAAHDAGLKAALAGSLHAGHMPILKRLAPDYVGLRGGLCDQGNRTARINPDRVRNFLLQAR
jgi:uncharacterized protein (UPF0264 family)